jgi:hypothetical protein
VPPKVRHRLPHGAVGLSSDDGPVEKAAGPGPRLVLDHDPVREAAVGRPEVALVTRVRQSLLDAFVRDELVGNELPERHLEHDLATEEPHDEASLIAWNAPARAWLDTDESWPEGGPRIDVSDEPKAVFEWRPEDLLTLNPNRGHSRAKGRRDRP